MQKALFRCLCFILTLWMAGSRPSAALGTGASHSDSWWGAKDAKQIRDAAQKLMAAGNFAAAEEQYQQGYQIASRRRDESAAIRYLISVAGARFGQFHYREALEPYLEARRRALTIGDVADAGAVALNLSSLYLQVWDLDSALRSAKEAQAASARLAGRGTPAYFGAPLALHLGRLHEVLEDGEAERYYMDGIEAARVAGDIRLEATGWRYIGQARLARHDLSGAERALDEAFRMSTLFDRGQLPFSWALLGALKLAQGDYASAAAFTDRAIAAAGVVDSTYPLYLLERQRGEIHMALGQREAALRDFASAIELASRWRREVPSSISAITAANVELEKRVFDSFIEAAAGEAVRTRNWQRMFEAFEATELNRAASLRQTLSFVEFWRKRLPPRYWELQALLRAEQARMLRSGEQRTARSEQLSLQLSEMEAETGLRFDNKLEKFSPQNSLIPIQGVIREKEVLLTFHLGRKESYLWSVTRRGLRLHRLLSAARLRADIGRFREAVRLGDGMAEEYGAGLYGELFGDLSREEREKPRWLLSVEDALFDLPFAALRESGAEFLVEKHSVEVIPGALLLSGQTGRPKANGWFLGVGDPIYNTADPRFAGRGWTGQGPFSGWFALAGTSQLNRLVASGSELQTAARSWHGGSTTLLAGAGALRGRFVALSAGEPSVIHLATHVLTPPARRDQAVIAFGVDDRGEPEYLTTSDVAMLHVPGALVTMSGCESGAGEVRAGAGLLGITRAWQMAGAGAVVATAWPVRDSDGGIFSSFYRNLHEAEPAEALRRAQVDMIHSGTWRAAPSYWASYEITGGAH